MTLAHRTHSGGGFSVPLPASPRISGHRYFVSLLGIYALVALIVTLGFGVRILQLGGQSLWYDETEAIRYAQNLVLRDVHPPTYYALLGLALQAGHSEFILRFPTVLQDILSIAVGFALARRLLGLYPALVTSLLMSMSAALIWHAQDVRMYSQLVLTTLLVTYAYARAVESDKGNAWILFSIACIAALYTHLYAILLLGTLALHFLCFHRRQLRRWVLANAAVALGYLPWLLIFIQLPAKQIGTGRSQFLFSFPYTFFTFTSGYSLGPSINELRQNDLHAAAPYVGIILVLSLVVVALLFLGCRHLYAQNRSRFFLLMTATFLPVVIAILVPLFRPSMTFNVRYVLFCAPPFLMLLAYGIAQLRSARLASSVLIFLLLVNGLSLYNNNSDPRYFKEDVRAAAKFLESNAGPDDRIVTITVGNAFRWYFDGTTPIIANTPSRPLEELLNMAAPRASQDRIWLVNSRPWQTDPKGQVEAALAARYSMGMVKSFPGVTVTEFCQGACS